MRPSAVELFRNAPASGCRVSVELRQAKGGAGSDRVAVGVGLLCIWHCDARAKVPKRQGRGGRGRTLDLRMPTASRLKILRGEPRAQPCTHTQCPCVQWLCFFWLLLGVSVVRALSNGQVGPPEGTLPRYLAKVPPPHHLAGPRSKVGWGGGPPCRPKVQGEVGGGHCQVSRGPWGAETPSFTGHRT